MDANMMKRRYLIGIDEVGRGPLAGPLAVGAMMIPSKKSAKILRVVFRGARDSKELGKKGREEWFPKIKQAKKDGILDYAVSFVGPKMIDEKGMTRATNVAIKRCLRKLGAVPERSRVLLDGGLKAPEEFGNQETIIRGDEKEKIIGLSSIVAKVARDRRMARLAKKFPNWSFEIHKGYGTAMHYECIRKYGICEIHRLSFLKRYVGAHKVDN